MPKYTFFTQAAKDGSNIAASSEELINCYSEQAPGDARTRLTVRSVLGEVDFADYGQSLIRNADIAVGDMWAVAANSLYQIETDGTVTNRGAVGDSLETSIAGNGTFVTVVSNGAYYVWDGAALTTPAGGAFSSYGSVTFSDYDTILTELNGRRFTWTATAAPATLDALDFASAEARDGNIVRGTVDRSQLYLFCENHIEVWRNTGLSGADRPSRYARLTVIDQGRGLKGYHLIARDSFGIFFVGNDGVAYIMSGNSMTPVSTPAVHTDIADGTAVSCGYYEDRGHKFCVLWFTDRPAWVYDITTLVWHRRQSGVDYADWNLRRMVGAFDGWYGFDDLGNVVSLERVNADRGLPLKRIMRGKPLDLEGQKFSIAEFEALCSVGESTLGSAATMMLRWSWNGGQTWLGTKEASLGDLGDYDTQARYYSLGRGEQWTPELSITDATDVVFYSDARVKIT